jgi:hypothetical protein
VVAIIGCHRAPWVKQHDVLRYELHHVPTGIMMELCKCAVRHSLRRATAQQAQRAALGGIVG